MNNYLPLAQKQERRALIAFILYLTLTILLTGGYVCWMFYERYQELVEFGEATKWVYVEFIPCWLSVVIFIIGFLYFLCDAEGCRETQYMQLNFAHIGLWKWTGYFIKYW